MEDAGRVLEDFLRQAPACHWITDASGVFRRVYGDSSSLFGKPPAKLRGRALSRALDRTRAKTWRGRMERVLGGETLLLRERHGRATWYLSVFPIRRRGRIERVGGMAREITPWSTAEQELRQTVLSALNAQESDRRRASKFLHDSVGQNLTALGLQLDLVRMDLEAPAPEASARLAEIQKMLETMMQQVRDYSYELNPSIVERAGLRPALERLVARLGPNFSGSFRLEADPSLKTDVRIASALYHIAQEAIENAIQHASCSVIKIALKSRRSGPVLEVRDNGRGFDPAEIVGVRRGLGLLSMEHYAAQAGLELSISSSPEGGTAVRAAVGRGSGRNDDAVQYHSGG